MFATTAWAIKKFEHCITKTHQREIQSGGKLVDCQLPVGAVDRDAVEVGAKPVAVGVAVREQATLQRLKYSMK